MIEKKTLVDLTFDSTADNSRRLSVIEEEDRRRSFEASFWSKFLKQVSRLQYNCQRLVKGSMKASRSTQWTSILICIRLHCPSVVEATPGVLLVCLCLLDLLLRTEVDEREYHLHWNLGCVQGLDILQLMLEYQPTNNSSMTSTKMFLNCCRRCNLF